MARSYKQLTQRERCQIQALKSSGQTQLSISIYLSVAPSTISRELSRNNGNGGYDCEEAQKKCDERRAKGENRPIKMTPELMTVIEDKLTQEQWSPAQISGWLKRTQGTEISHESIYKHIWEDKKAGGQLYLHLRRKSKKYMKRVNGKTTRGRIIGRVDISERPAIIETRSRLGDWEGDTVVGLGHRSALVTLVDRKSRYTKIVKVEHNTAELVTNAIIGTLDPVKALALSITFDNGKEFSYHQRIAASLELETFFATPYHSWERGTNENTNGLIRQYFPKKTDFSDVTDEEVARVEALLNTRPRKILGFRTPEEVFREAA